MTHNNLLFHVLASFSWRDVDPVYNARSRRIELPIHVYTLAGRIHLPVFIVILNDTILRNAHAHEYFPVCGQSSCSVGHSARRLTYFSSNCLANAASFSSEFSSKVPSSGWEPRFCSESKRKRVKCRINYGMSFGSKWPSSPNCSQQGLIENTKSNIHHKGVWHGTRGPQMDRKYTFFSASATRWP